MKTWRYFWELMKFRPRYYATDLSGATVHFTLETVTGLILRAYFNGLTGAPGGLPLWQVVGMQLLWLALALVSLYLAVIAYINFTQHGMALLLRNLLARILQRPGARALPPEEDGAPISTGKALSTLRDDVSDMAHSIILIDDVVALSVTSAVAFGIMFSINPLVTVGTFLPLLLIIVIAQRLGGLAVRYRRASRQATSEVTAMIADMFHATQAIKVANAEERIVARFREINEQRRGAMVRDRLLTQLVDALSEGTVDVGLGFILLAAAQAMAGGDFSVGDFALFAAYIWPATQLMRRAGNLITRYKQVGVATERMARIMQGRYRPDPEQMGAVVEHHPIYLRQPLPALPHMRKEVEDWLHRLEVRGLHYRHPDAEEGAQLRDVDLTLERGTVTVVTGRIGSGKSTLLKVLLGLLPAEAGEIRWNGQLVTDPTSFMAPPRVAYTGQVPHLFSESLRDNILLGLYENEHDVMGAVRTAVLEEDLAAMEEGLETEVGPRGVRLSGGQVQRAAAARMFVRDAELLVLDDLSSALDVETERLLWERLFVAAERPTMLVVSHRREVLQRADQIIILQEGRVSARGTLQELLASSAEMRALMQQPAEDGGRVNS